jgi:hypothetical protein
MPRLSEIFFSALIGVTLVLPASLTLWVHCTNPAHQFDWIANRTLVGVTLKSDLPPVTPASWLHGDLQKGISAFASEGFAGREFLIRIYNQILYHVFKKSYMVSGAIIRGKHDNLFELGYLAEYGRYQAPVKSKELEALVVMMKYLSLRLKEFGSCFVFVITPSKPTLCPEDIPDRYLTNLQRRPRKPTNYEILVPLLHEYEVPYIDGCRCTLEHKDMLPMRAFPKTGVHWNRATAFFTATDLLKTIEEESGRKMPQLSESVASIDRLPDYSDADLFELLNLIDKPHGRYLHPAIQIPENWPKRRGIVTFVGGSFTAAILEDLEMAQVFERMNFYSYFKLFRLQYPGRVRSSVSENSVPWEEEFLNTTAVVLEANEGAIWSGHIPAFLMAGLAALDQRKLKEPSTDSLARPFCWGFGVGQNGTSLKKKGFCDPEPDLTWISGQDAEIDLPSPQTDTELQLILQAAPFLGDDISKRVVKVEANGIPVGILELKNADSQFYSLTIKTAANRASSLKLHLSFSPAPSPVSGGIRSREISFTRLALVPIRIPASRASGENHATLTDRE